MKSAFVLLALFSVAFAAPYDTGVKGHRPYVQKSPYENGDYHNYHNYHGYHHYHHHEPEKKTTTTEAIVETTTTEIAEIATVKAEIKETLFNEREDSAAALETKAEEEDRNREIITQPPKVEEEIVTVAIVEKKKPEIHDSYLNKKEVEVKKHNCDDEPSDHLKPPHDHHDHSWHTGPSHGSYQGWKGNPNRRYHPW